MSAFRPTTSADYDFLIKMLGLAAGLPEDQQHHDQVLATPELSRYIIGWMRRDDLGVLAMDNSGTPIGAAWLRYLTAENPGYGYVSDDIPELSIAVIDRWRRRGVGRALLRAVLEAARGHGTSVVSLSTGRGSYQARLYASEGFRVVGSIEGGETVVMIADLTT